MSVLAPCSLNCLKVSVIATCTLLDDILSPCNCDISIWSELTSVESGCDWVLSIWVELISVRLSDTSNDKIDSLPPSMTDFHGLSIWPEGWVGFRDFLAIPEMSNDKSGMFLFNFVLPSSPSIFVEAFYWKGKVKWYIPVYNMMW